MAPNSECEYRLEELLGLNPTHNPTKLSRRVLVRLGTSQPVAAKLRTAGQAGTKADTERRDRTTCPGLLIPRCGVRDPGGPPHQDGYPPALRRAIVCGYLTSPATRLIVAAMMTVPNR
jgi:hypothetical protein